MKKRLASLLLALCMILSLLPGTAYAAVADLLENTAQQNQSLLQQLESFTGESYEEAYALLDSLGLLDRDGNLVTDQSIVLNGVEYTLDQIEALLADPSVDLTQVAQVDGVPIALSDLKTIIAIERQLQYLQETYFSGRTFDGEALENVNDLLNQLQSEGLTLAANNAGNELVLNQEGSDGSIDGYTTAGYIRASNVLLTPGTTYQVKFKLAVPEAIRVLGEDIKIKVCFDTELDSHNPLAAVEILVSEAVANPDKEYTLSYTAQENSAGTAFPSDFYLHAAYKQATLGFDITPDSLSGAIIPTALLEPFGAASPSTSRKGLYLETAAAIKRIPGIVSLLTSTPCRSWWAAGPRVPESANAPVRARAASISSLATAEKPTTLWTTR